MVVEKVSRSMSTKFNYVVGSIKESNNVTTLSIEELQSSLLVHEQRMKGQNNIIEEQALKVSNAGRGTGKGRGRLSRRDHGKGRESREIVECYKCHKLGHYQSECPSWEESANYTKFDEEEKMILMVKRESRSWAKKKIWYLDFGCTNHMVGVKTWLFYFDGTF